MSPVSGFGNCKQQDTLSSTIRSPATALGSSTFSSALSVATDLTKDAARVRTSAILPDSAAHTALIDATYSAMTVSRSPTGRALVIVFSDGIDTASFLRPARRADDGETQ